MAGTLPEPWMRGPIEGISPLIAPVLYSFQQATEDLIKSCASLSVDQIWDRPHGLAPLGFHLKHIAGSIDRLTTYLKGEPLSPDQFEALGAEMTAGATIDELLASLETCIENASAAISKLDPARLTDARTVGRQRLPTTVIGLLVHIAEHTQRHVGQAISAAQLAQRR